MTKPRIRMDEKTTAVINSDGWSNLLTSLGNRKDANQHTRFTMPWRLDQKTLTSIFTGDGLGRRVVTLPVDDALREWIECDNKLKAELKRLRAKQEVKDAGIWARLFGGSVLVAVLDDGMDMTLPVDTRMIRRVLELRVYDRFRVTWTSSDLQTDPMAENFGRVEIYTITPINGTPYKVHHTRLHRFDGMSLPDDERQRNQGWGDSALQTVYNALMNYGTAMLGSAQIVRDFVQVVLGIKGLTDMIVQGNEKIVTKRAELIDMTRSVANLVMVDADGETYSKHASSVAGLADLWDRFALHVSACTGIPATKLMGRSPAGLNATGEGDNDNWDDTVREYQTDEMQPAIEWVVSLCEAQLDWPKADRPETYDFTFPALSQPSESEWATMKKTNAETDQIYYNMGAIDPEYTYHLRHGQGEYRAEINFDPMAYAQWLQERNGVTDPQ